MTPREFLILVLALWALLFWSGEADAGDIVLTLGVGNNTNLSGSSIPWEDGDGTGTFLRLGYEAEFDGAAIGAHWVHLSQYEVGPPWNDDPESSVDHFGVYVEFRW